MQSLPAKYQFNRLSPDDKEYILQLERQERQGRSDRQRPIVEDDEAELDLSKHTPPLTKEQIAAIREAFNDCLVDKGFTSEAVINACSDFLKETTIDAKLRALVYSKRAHEHLITNERDKALSDLDQSAQLDPATKATFTERGNIYFEDGDFDKAIADYSIAVDGELLPSQTLLWRGVAYALNGDLDKAKMDFQRNSAAWTTHDILFRMVLQMGVVGNAGEALLGYAYLRSGDEKQAIQHFTEFLKISKDPAIYTERGMLFLQQGKLQQAIDDFSLAIGLKDSKLYRYSPDHSEAFLGRAEAYQRLGNVIKSEEDKRQAEKQAPKEFEQLIYRCLFRLARGDYVGAAKDARQSEKFPESHWAQNIAQVMLARQMGVPVPTRKTKPPVVIQTTADGHYDLAIEPSIAASFSGAKDVKVNGASFTIVNVNPDKLTLLGDAPPPIKLGLNFFQMTKQKVNLWYQRKQLQEFVNPYNNSHALLIAIDKYDKKRQGFDELHGMVDNAKLLESTLRDLGFSTIRPLYDGNATKQNIEDALKDYLVGERYEGVDRLVIYFGGHGAIETEGNNGFLVTYDHDPTKPLSKSFLMRKFIFEYFLTLKPKHILVALDARSSGLAIPGATPQGEPSAEHLLDLATLDAKSNGSNRDARNIPVASTKDNSAFNYQGGLFTSFLIEGLKGDADLNKDGVVHFDELYFYVRDKVHGYAFTRFQKQQEPDGYVADALGKKGRILFPLTSRSIQ